MNDNFMALPKEKQQFLKMVISGAQASRHMTGIPASVISAQCLLESGWGQSELARYGRNFFGVKADRDWTGPVILLPTKEFEGGKWITITARWRKYGSVEESIRDHAMFLLSSARYKETLKNKNDYKKFCHALQAAGYATDPKYAEKLIRVIESYGLQFYDFPVP